MYLGDPTLYPWSDAPHNFVITSPTSVSKGAQVIDVVVEQYSEPAWPVMGAQVSLCQGGKLVATDTTDSLGEVTFAIDVLDDSPIELGVFKRNFWFIVDTISVADSRSLINLDSVIYSDDSVGLGTGNGNGNVEAGEAIRAALVLRNTGEDTLTNILCSLYTPDSLVTILRDTLTLDTVLPYTTVETTLGLAFEVASSTADLTFLDDLQLTILFSDTSVCCTIACGVFSGIVDLGGFTIDDDQLGSSDGDGDGVIESLEYVEFPVIITNTGHGVLENVWARLIPVDTQHIMFNPGVDSISYGDIPPMSGPAPPDTFEFYVVGVPSSTDMIVEVHDHYGNVDSLLFSATTNVRVPTGIDFICRNNSIRLIWTCDSLSANAGYNLYRKPEGGSYSKVNSHPIVGATIYEDDGLDENTTYYYKIAVLDTQLSESRFSPPFKAATNPPQPYFWPVGQAADNLTPMTVPLRDTGASTTFFCYEEHIIWLTSYGWPQGQQAIFQSAGTGASFAYNSLSVEDVDGDGNLEVFIPSSGSDGKLYGFEIVAGTGAPEQGWPVSLPTDNDVICSPITIADVDHDGDYELFTCTHEGNVCALNHDGSPLIGDSINFFSIPDPDTIGGHGLRTYSAVAVGDIDGDGEMDLVVTDNHREIYAFDLSGNILSGFPVTLAGTSYPMHISSPVLADFDNDRNGMEILVNLVNQKIYLVDGDGSILLSWPDTAFGIPQVSYTMIPPSPIDIDGDNILEIVTLINNQLVVIDQQGEIQSGWPYAIYDIIVTGISLTPLIGDIDDDGAPEILLNLGNGLIHGFNADGTPAAGFAMEEQNAGGGIPVLSDLTGQGDLYIMKGGQTVKAWQTGHGYVRENMTWPMFQHDNHRTGSIFGTKPIIEDIDTPVAVGKEDTITVTATVDEADARWGDSLFYVWTVAKGTINGSGASVSYIAPSYVTTDTLELLVYDCGGNTVTDTRTMNITLGGGEEGSCPFLYVKTAEGFQQDNTILTQSEGNSVQGQNVTDYYLTGFRPLVENGIATFDIREIEVERSYIDQVTLLQVAVPVEFDLSVSSDGEIALVSPGIIIPYEAHAGDLNITSLILDDDQSYSGSGPLDLDIEIGEDHLGDSIVVDIFLLGGIKGPHGIPKPDGLADSFTPMRLAGRGGGGPASELTSAPRANGSVVSFKLGNPGVGSLSLQLDWEDKATISKLTVSPVIPYDLNVASISPATVYLNDNERHHDELSREDGRFVQVMPGDILRMQFEGITDPPPGIRYEYVFKSTGYYTSFNDRGDRALLPDSPMLYPNYPNPFNPITNIPFALPASGHVTIEVYNVLGQNVRTLLDGQVSTGFHVIQWDGRSSSGSPVASGVYYVRMQSGETVTTRNMSLVK